MWLWVQNFAYTVQLMEGPVCGSRMSCTHNTGVTRSLSNKRLSVWSLCLALLSCALFPLPAPLGTPYSCHTNLLGTFLHLKGGIFVLQEGHTGTTGGIWGGIPRGGDQTCGYNGALEDHGDEAGSLRWVTNWAGAQSPNQRKDDFSLKVLCTYGP